MSTATATQNLYNSKITLQFTRFNNDPSLKDGTLDGVVSINVPGLHPDIKTAQEREAVAEHWLNGDTDEQAYAKIADGIALTKVKQIGFEVSLIAENCSLADYKHYIHPDNRL